MLVAESHESYTSPCGVIFSEQFEAIPRVRILPLGPLHRDLARKLADGSHSFLLYEKDQFVGLVFFAEPITSELQIMQLLPPAGGLILQRNEKGVTKFFRPESITTHERRIWNTKPNVKEAARRIAQCVVGVDRSVLNRILEFAFHGLSPAFHTGATLVWYLDPPTPQDLSELSAQEDLMPLELSVLDERDSAAVCHLLSQIDGATILDPAGKLICSGVQLRYSERSAELIPELRGTRHTSARRFSYDKSQALVITVSEDGPVTVFFNGASIADLRTYSSKSEAKLLKSAAPDRIEDITHRSFEVICEKCEKLAMLEEVMVQGCEARQSSQCPTCLAMLHSSSCFSLEARPFKRVNGPGMDL